MAAYLHPFMQDICCFSYPLTCFLRHVLKNEPAESTKDVQDTSWQMKTWEWLPVMAERSHTGTHMVDASMSSPEERLTP